MQKSNINNVGVAAHNDPINQKGITIIALIIIIIVMLILVGVTINVALNGGLFEKAETATKETEEKAILEEMLAMMEIDNNGKFKPDDIIANMRTKHPDYEIIYNKPNATITGKLGEYNYIVSETEIKIGSKEIKPFDWEDVGLIVDTDTDYKFYDLNTSTTYGINFTAEGKLILKANEITVETYDATDDKNINSDGKLIISITDNGTSYDVIITMNSNNVDVDAKLNEFTIIPFAKINPIAYGDYNSAMILQNSSNEYYMWMNTFGAVKCNVQQCTDITKLSAFKSNQYLTNNSNIEYSYALLESDGACVAVWSESAEAWFLVMWSNGATTGAAYYVNIIGEMPLTKNTNVTQEQINSIIQSANATNE